MNRRRAAWLSLAVVLLVLGVVAGPELFEAARYRTERGVEPIDDGADGSVVYWRIVVPRWGDTASEFPTAMWEAATHRAESVHFVAMSQPPRPATHVLRTNGSRTIRTHFSADGGVEFQMALRHPSKAAKRPPWPYPIPYTPAEVRQLIHEAKLYVQEAAQRGEVELPEGWEYVE